jgi:hypothetical protein
MTQVIHMQQLQEYPFANNVHAPAALQAKIATGRRDPYGWIYYSSVIHFKTTRRAQFCKLTKPAFTAIETTRPVAQRFLTQSQAPTLQPGPFQPFNLDHQLVLLLLFGGQLMSGTDGVRKIGRVFLQCHCTADSPAANKHDAATRAAVCRCKSAGKSCSIMYC